LNKQENWYQLPLEKTFQTLDTSTSGLSSSEAISRLERYGHNEIKVKKRGPLIRFLLQFNNGLLYVLIAAAILTAILAKFLDMYVIIGVIMATVVIGFIQEGKAEASLEALKNMLVLKCTVLRDGEKETIPSRELVPGDIVLIEAGDKVPADLYLFSTKELHADEAALTGESLPITKNTEPIPKPNLTPGEQLCMCFSGTFITRGRGEGVVVATGKETEVGKIAGMMEETKRVPPPIMKKIAEFTKFVIIACLSFGVINLILGTILGYKIGYMLLATAGMIVAMIPEGLAAAIIAAFAVGAIHMAHKHALIRRLPAAETLGCTTVICSDKTGTLTKNEMTVVKLHCGGKDYQISGVGYKPEGQILQDSNLCNPIIEDKELIATLTAGHHCSNAVLVKDEDNSDGYNIKGDPTEGSLVVAAAKAGICQRNPCLDEMPFDSELMYMATLHKEGNDNIIYVKGSPEIVLNMCTRQLSGNNIETVNKENILEKIDEMAADALRVLAMACKYVDAQKTTLTTEDMEGLTFLGLQGMIDPPRNEAIEAIKICKKAGIRPVMITGDHVLTAKAIAKQLGIGLDEERALTGQELSQMSDDELFQMVDSVSVYARVAPEHKYRITKQLQRKGHIVAMTGDGVNDAPALKAADIGVAMGITGTEVSKEAADMVLTDDNFASIVSAVEEGRHVFTNIWKVILFLLPTNGGQGLVMIGAVLMSPFIAVFRERLPIEPIQILWVNLIMAIACSIPLIWEPKDKGILEKPPRKPNEKLFSLFFLQRVGTVSVISAVAAFGMFLFFINTMGSGEGYLTQAQTIAFTTLIMVQLVYLFTARSITESAFTFSPFSNKVVLIGAATTLGLQLIIVYSEPLFGFSPFRTQPFPAVWWIPVMLVSLLGFFAIEMEKVFTRRISKPNL